MGVHKRSCKSKGEREREKKTMQMQYHSRLDQINKLGKISKETNRKLTRVIGRSISWVTLTGLALRTFTTSISQSCGGPWCKHNLHVSLHSITLHKTAFILLQISKRYYLSFYWFSMYSIRLNQCIKQGIHKYATITIKSNPAFEILCKKPSKNY